MRFGSVCSGIEAASVAWHPLGWRAAWLSEIEPFPSAVLAHHYPEVPNHGDMTRLPVRILTGEVEAPDVFCGGTPCQAFSVAGLRQSLDDARGNLSLTFCEIADAIDHVRGLRGQPPAIIFWENVPGVLSTKDNAFGCFLAGLAGEDEPLQPPGQDPKKPIRWSNAGCVYGPARAVAWRTLDAQYFGVAQRRRRVFVVASARDEFDPAAVLFEWDGVRRDTAPSREAGKIAPTIPARSTAGGGLGTDFDCDGGLIPNTAQCLTTGSGKRYDPETETILPVGGVKYAHYSHDYAHDRITDPSGVNPALTKEAHASGNLNVAVAVSLRGREGGATAELGDEVQNCLRASQGGGDKPHVLAPVAGKALYNKGFNHEINYASTQETDAGKILRALREAVGEEAFAQWGLGILGSLQSPEILRQALHGSGIRPAAFSRSWVVYCALSRQENGSDWLLQSLREAGSKGCPPQGWEPSEQLAGELRAYLSELSQPGAQASRFMRDLWGAAQGAGVLRQALSAVQEMGRPAHDQGQPAHGAMQVRRLTPEEAEFLQGFPRGYTAIPWRKKPADQCTDGPRYKALGNSWAVPVVRWIGQRISNAAR